MRLLFILIQFLGFVVYSSAQDLYFPPSNSDIWLESDAICDATQLAELETFLSEKNTKAFIMLKDGRLLSEMYFDGFSKDSVWYWASAGKSLVSMMIGKAQQDGALSIEDATADYLGQGWTVCDVASENEIKIKHQISMSTGLDASADFNCTDPVCLTCFVEPGSRWFYHNGPYTLTQSVLQAATGQSATSYFNTKFGSVIGGTGAFIPLSYDRVFFSKARTMAKVGLLALAQGNWDGTQIYQQDAYFDQMIQPSQDLNQAYGYLWWLNGSETHQLPGTTLTFNGSIIPAAPADLYAGMGKNDQRLYIVPSQGLVVVRLGNSADSTNFALSDFDDQLWQRISTLDCLSTSVTAATQKDYEIFPNPSTGQFRISGSSSNSLECEVFDTKGQLLGRFNEGIIDISSLKSGIYYLKIIGDQKEEEWEKIVLIK